MNSGNIDKRLPSLGVVKIYNAAKGWGDRARDTARLMNDFRATWVRAL